MKISRIYAIFLRQIYLMRSNLVRLVSYFLWLIIDIIQWGFITKYLITFGQNTFGFVTVVLGAIILWEFMTRIQQGIMTSFLEDIWVQNFINYFSSPLEIKEYLSGLVLTSIFTSVIGIIIMVLIAGLAFGYNIFILGVYIIPFILVLFIFGVAMGFLILAVIFRFGPSAEWLGWPVPLVLSIFTGVFYPVATLPGVLQIISRLIPASYVFESVRSLISTGIFSSALWFNLLIGFVLALVYLFLAYKFFMKIYSHNLKTGAIPRFSAE